MKDGLVIKRKRGNFIFVIVAISLFVSYLTEDHKAAKGKNLHPFD